MISSLKSMASRISCREPKIMGETSEYKATDGASNATENDEYEAFKLQKNTAYDKQTLSVVVLGASGDLAKKKTYPALYDLFSHGYLPKTCVNIVGFARSESTDEAFREKIAAFLPKEDPEKVNKFLAICTYFQGQYGSEESFSLLHSHLLEKESVVCSSNGVNRLFYFAIPPNVFIPSARAIDSSCRSQQGWNRIVVEKPFGHDLESALQMSSELTSLWDEDDIYRIDHYLGRHILLSATTTTLFYRINGLILNIIC
jgi:glucose-6-phosphate 1-dehydrogenase